MSRPPRLVTPRFALITAAAFTYFTGYALTIPTLPRYLAGPLGGDGVAVGLGVGAFGITALLLRPWVGTIGDRKGRLLLIIFGSSIVTLSVAGLLLSSALWHVVALRLLAGAGEAMFFVGSVTAINDLAPPERRGEAVSIFTVSLYLGIAVGPSIGETILGDGRYDGVWIASAALTAMTFLLALGITETHTPQPDAPRFTVRRALHPAGLFPGLVMFTSVFGFAGYMAFMPLYAIDLGLGGARTILLVYGFLTVAIRIFGRTIPDRYGPERVGLVGLTISMTGLLFVGVIRSELSFYAGSIVFAIGQAITFPSIMSSAASRAPAAERGAAIGTTTAFIDLGFVLGPVMLGVVAATLDHHATFLGGAAMAAIGVAFQLVARSRTRVTASAD